ncbi:MAG: adenosylhomocysteinase [Candidatus Dormibacteraeota bacterium]|uniref:Adenosylhomocysteinase n=1 Tax=Candidatus Dormiibacter inghamiae TaxID=3127013 RepID=A0A934KFX3_9BACT|nr:adenosylhomocysteinase [Candidatus Dormibacteraeota bacterium]MBJ7607083.1 adenosylhomocysteinase [Candidatus Dormibacteraeota bacterium]
MRSVVKDPHLAPGGGRKLDLAGTWAPVLNRVRERLLAEGSVRDRRVGIILPVEPKTAYLAVMLAEAGAQVALAAPGALTQDDVAAALAERGVQVFARSDSTPERELEFYSEVLDRRPEVVIDDRAALIRMAHTTHPQALQDLIGASEETTTGVVTLRAMAGAGALRIPCIAANDARCKHLFDNRYGTGQSTITAVLDSTNLLLAGKVLLVIGYSWVGKGIAARARGMGAKVTVSEVDPIAALEAFHDGFRVEPVIKACETAEIVMTATGVPNALPPDAIDRLPDGALLANAGAVDDEFDLRRLRERAQGARLARRNVEEFRLANGRSVFVIGDGKVVNLSAGEGHPVEIMDLTFSVQALSARHLLLHGSEMDSAVHLPPPEIDQWVARQKLQSLGVSIDHLTPEQERYSSNWEAHA